MYDESTQIKKELRTFIQCLSHHGSHKRKNFHSVILHNIHRLLRQVLIIHSSNFNLGKKQDVTI